MASIFLPPPPPPPPVPTLADEVRRIEERIQSAFAVQKDVYLWCQSRIHANAHYTPEQVIVALGDKYPQIQLAAVIAKSQMNFVVPGTIDPSDTVPTAIIVLPSDPMYAEILAMLGTP
jgi:hypothetical protein